jgi:Pyruvate/2-oxoacid:ferredoxin oxidoreductase gamma subunit
MERQLLFTGIGGQGVQLAAHVLAAAALAEGRDVQLFGSYGGMMRGGATEASVVFSTGAVEAPPTLGAAWSVVLMHDEHSAHARGCLRPGSTLFVNSSVVAHSDGPDGVTLLEVPATTIASDVGHPNAVSLVMAGAYATATGIVSMSSLTAAAADALPPYRAKHRALNEAALIAGAGAVVPGVAAAWPEGER